MASDEIDHELTKSATQAILSEFAKLLKSDDDEDSFIDNNQNRNEEELEEAASELLGSDQFATVFVGTSKQSQLEASTIDDALNDEIFRRDRNKKLTLETEIITNQLSNDSRSDYGIESSEFVELNDETLTLVEEGEDEDEDEDEDKKRAEDKSEADVDAILDQHQEVVPQHRLRRTVMTILLTNKWQRAHPRKIKKRASRKVVKFEPTYRMQPRVDIGTILYLVEGKTRHTFESLVEKHGKYDVEYTPRFLRIITEMIKNDVKSFRLERYKIVVSVLILKKVLQQSAQFVSQMLYDHDNDHRICLNMDTRSFYAVCLIFLVYHE